MLIFKFFFYCTEILVFETGTLLFSVRGTRMAIADVVFRSIYHICSYGTEMGCVKNVKPC